MHYGLALMLNYTHVNRIHEFSYRSVQGGGAVSKPQRPQSNNIDSPNCTDPHMLGGGPPVLLPCPGTSTIGSVRRSLHFPTTPTG